MLSAQVLNASQISAVVLAAHQQLLLLYPRLLFVNIAQELVHSDRLNIKLSFIKLFSTFYVSRNLYTQKIKFLFKSNCLKRFCDQNLEKILLISVTFLAMFFDFQIIIFQINQLIHRLIIMIIARNLGFFVGRIPNV